MKTASFMASSKNNWRGVDLVPALVRLEVDVHRASLVPAGIDGVEGDRARLVGGLEPRRNVRVRGGGAETGVVAGGVGVPDLDRRAGIGVQRVGVDDREVEAERRSRLALGDVAADRLAVEVVRALGHLRREHARGGRRAGARPGDEADDGADDVDGAARRRATSTRTSRSEPPPHAAATAASDTGPEQAEGFTSGDRRGHLDHGASPSLERAVPEDRVVRRLCPGTARP